MKLQDDTTVKEETRKAFAHNTEMKARLDKMQQEMADRTDYESESYAQLVEKFTQEHERYMMMGGNYEAEIERTLTGLGFTREDFDRPTREFSGGWRMRIELAKILLQKPDVLLLDEPTNHLDIESIQWLEQFLAQSAKAVVLVSHDRAFINNVTNRTLEITCGRVEDYRVKYDEYVVLRAERREQQLRAYENQQKEIADIKDFIERFRYKPTKAVQVQSRIKQLEKIVPIEVDEVDNKQMHLKFPPCLRSGDYPIICDEVRKDYGSHTVFDHDDGVVHQGADHQNQREHGQSIDAHVQEVEEEEGADERYRNRDRWNDRRAPVLQEEVGDHHHQNEGEDSVSTISCIETTTNRVES